MKYRVTCQHLGLALNKIARQGDLVDAADLPAAEIPRLAAIGAIIEVESLKTEVKTRKAKKA